MRPAKYIIFDKEFPVIFPAHFNHDDTATLTRRLAYEAGLDGIVTSAGFVEFGSVSGRLVAHGKSESLGIASDPELDSYIINHLLQVPAQRPKANV